MPQKFNLTEIISRSKPSAPIPKRHHIIVHATTPVQRLKEFAKQYSTRLWTGFYISLIIASFLTGIGVEQSRLAKIIMDSVRSQQQLQYPTIPPDKSSLSLTNTPGMVTYFIFPGGSKIGDAAEGIRYLEVTQVSLTSQNSTSQAIESSKSWGATAHQPPSGSYVLDFSSRYRGEYSFVLKVYGRNGQLQASFNQKLSLESYDHRRYILTFDKNNSINTSLTYFETIYAE